MVYWPWLFSCGSEILSTIQSMSIYRRHHFHRAQKNVWCLDFRNLTWMCLMSISSQMTPAKNFTMPLLPAAYCTITKSPVLNFFVLHCRWCTQLNKNFLESKLLLVKNIFGLSPYTAHSRPKFNNVQASNSLMCIGLLLII